MNVLYALMPVFVWFVVMFMSIIVDCYDKKWAEKILNWAGESFMGCFGVGMLILSILN